MPMLADMCSAVAIDIEQLRHRLNNRLRRLARIACGSLTSELCHVEEKHREFVAARAGNGCLCPVCSGGGAGPPPEQTVPSAVPRGVIDFLELIQVNGIMVKMQDGRRGDCS